MKVYATHTVEIQVLASIPQTAAGIISEDSLRFVGFLCATYEDRRQALLKNRELLASSYDALEVPSFNNSREVSDSEWKCAAIPDDIKDRRVEITGPVDRKMILNGLNSGANVFMADFEDSTSPTWKNIVEGQKNLNDAVNHTISFRHPKTGKLYKLNDTTAVLFCRPRGFHLDECHILVNGKPASASLVDFALYFFHNAHVLIKKGSGPYFYLPKVRSLSNY